MEQDVLVLTPEKAIVSFRLAGLGSRIIAHVFDLIVVTVAIVILSVIVSMLGAADQWLTSAFVSMAVFLVPLGYFILLEGLWNGQTLGKKICRLRVRMGDGTPITFVGALGRNLLRPADMLPGIYFVGLFAMFTNPKAQRIGDLVANTVVVEDRLPEPRFTITPHSVGFHPLESNVGDLRGMTIAEYNALRRFADRFPELPPVIQQKLVKEVWNPIATKRNIPAYTNVHPIYLAEAAVMKYGREHGLL